jgi:hypothetical protein
VNENFGLRGARGMVGRGVGVSEDGRVERGEVSGSRAEGGEEEDEERAEVSSEDVAAFSLCVGRKRFLVGNIPAYDARCPPSSTAA